MGLDRNVDLTIDQHNLILKLLDQYLPNTTTWAFGSRVKLTSNPKSDLDLVAFVSEAQRMQVWSLREEFEESDLPFRVDLLIWDEISEEFQEEIQKHHFCLVEKAPSKIEDVSV